MRRKHTTLPGLQAAAALYLARASEAKVFCADSSRTVVPDASCQGVETPGRFFVFNKDVADMVPNTRVGPEIDMYDASDVITRQNAEYPPPPQSAATSPSTGSLDLRDNGWYCDADEPGIGRPNGGGTGTIVIGYFGRGYWSTGG
ncbi:hypothetical protein CDEST_12588 [Colletotrichum destructivum]|uniref:Uncharacterized protein n=1 Tax=Colletotrichum destructivum TaxID=34406 RepID=A0AAX4IWF7_9PEZI|nr:hypothetical protein CDEST_12588 [Colletotrichum destructivum]